jgi:ATP-binding cassette subfamily B protein
MALLYSYVKQYRALVVLALVLAATNQIFSFLDPLIFRHIIDDYATKYESLTRNQFFRGVGFLLFLAMSVAFISRVAKNFQDYFVNVITQRLGAQMYRDGIRHSLELPYSVFEDQRSGETLGKLQKARSDVEKLIQLSINLLFTTMVGMVFVIIYGFSVHWAIVVAFFATIPLLGILSSILSKRIKTIQKVIVAETTALAGSTTESLRNIELVKSLGLAEQEVVRLNATTDKILKLELKKVRYLRSLSFVQGTFVNFIRTCILFLMLYLIFARRITIGQFFSTLFYSFFIFGPMQELGNIIGVYRETEASLENFQKILNTPKDPKPVKPVPLHDLDNLVFENVGFMHQTATLPALTDISFSVKRGDTIAFVGPSGAGKTTLVKLLVGLYPPKTGRILYNGYPSTDIDLDRMRERIGFVTQDAQLFSGTIRENLLFVNPTATDEECLDVLHKACRQGTRHGDWRRRRESFGRREAASFHRTRTAPAPASAGVRRGDVLARFADGRGDQPDDARHLRYRQRHHHSHRAPFIYRSPLRPHLRARARKDHRDGQARGTSREEGTVLRDVATAGGRAAAGTGAAENSTRNDSPGTGRGLENAQRVGQAVFLGSRRRLNDDRRLRRCGLGDGTRCHRRLWHEGRIRR